MNKLRPSMYLCTASGSQNKVNTLFCLSLSILHYFSPALKRRCSKTISKNHFVTPSFFIKKTTKFALNGKNQLVIDAKKLPATAKWRTRETGDVFKKFGSGEKKLKDYTLSHSKITDEEYDSMERYEWYMDSDTMLSKGLVDEIL